MCILGLIKGPVQKKGILGTPKKKGTAIGQGIPEGRMQLSYILLEEFVVGGIEAGGIEGAH